MKVANPEEYVESTRWAWRVNNIKVMAGNPENLDNQRYEERADLGGHTNHFSFSQTAVIGCYGQNDQLFK